ncbi:hypothetical protein SISSUDRAFT_1054686 [Sistotremastrum suecicum HHB10207 ss-3]|uniref:MYND-type domain-containing protein n=1 Tax=Sistotremastrum suecicum HHB10207 ss-3 TaxID=1314776 RepID=A0A165YA90_9AGAM|nr:hypothetical protein SISSUDRAFT_1054686 [Sistotremastrum suecicum HHB10207 ss-3]
MSTHGPRCGCAEEGEYLYEEWLHTQKDPNYKAMWPIVYTCFHCGNRMYKPLRCSACKAIIYCSANCSKMNWKRHMKPGGFGEGHKENCGAIKEQMSHLDAFNEIAAQFPWSVKHGGYYDLDLTLASRKLHGIGPAFGWWTVPPCDARESHAFGNSYLQRSSHLTELEGWKLPENEIPWFNFDESKGRVPPQSLPNFADSWASYYEWRKLPISSPAAHLLHWPLTIYRMLRVLGIDAGSVQTRKSLTIFLVGVEKELGFLPVFGELALLLPYCDVHLVLFGRAVFNAVKSAKAGSLARQETVYSHSAPETLGGGTIKMTLHSKTPFYDPQTYSERPDVIVGQNAGVTTYPEWMPILVHSVKKGIPFIVTDYVSASLDECDNGVRAILWNESRNAASSEVGRLMKGANQVRKRILNEFMSPALRYPNTNFLPHASNAWIYVVNSEDS